MGLYLKRFPVTDQNHQKILKYFFTLLQAKFNAII